MTREERIKRGLVGKKTFIDKSSGKEFTIDFEDEERGCTLTMEEFMERNGYSKRFTAINGDTGEEIEMNPDNEV